MSSWYADRGRHYPAELRRVLAGVSELGSCNYQGAAERLGMAPNLAAAWLLRTWRYGFTNREKRRPASSHYMKPAGKPSYWYWLTESGRKYLVWLMEQTPDLQDSVRG